MPAAGSLGASLIAEDHRRHAELSALFGGIYGTSVAADCPNVLEVLPKPRAGLPPVDFGLLMRHDHLAGSRSSSHQAPWSRLSGQPMRISGRPATQQIPPHRMPPRVSARPSSARPGQHVPAPRIPARPSSARPGQRVTGDQADWARMQPLSAREPLRMRRRHAASGANVLNFDIDALQQWPRPRGPEMMVKISRPSASDGDRRSASPPRLANLAGTTFAGLFGPPAPSPRRLPSQPQVVTRRQFWPAEDDVQPSVSHAPAIAEVRPPWMPPAPTPVPLHSRATKRFDAANVRGTTEQVFPPASEYEVFPSAPATTEGEESEEEAGEREEKREEDGEEEEGEEVGEEGEEEEEVESYVHADFVEQPRGSHEVIESDEVDGANEPVESIVIVSDETASDANEGEEGDGFVKEVGAARSPKSKASQSTLARRASARGGALARASSLRRGVKLPKGDPR